MRIRLMVAAIGALSVPNAQAATIRVPEDAPDVLKGVDLAQPGDSVIVGPGVWTERATRTIQYAGGLTSVTANAFLKGGIVLKSSAGAEGTTVQATEVGPGDVFPALVFANQAGQSVVIEGFTVIAVQSGLDAPGVSANPPSVTVRGCRFLNSGRGIWVVNSDLVLEDCEFGHNGLPVWGFYAVGVAASSSDIEMLRCSFHHNVGTVVELFSSWTEGNASIVRDCEFVENKGAGKGLSILNQPTVEVERTLFLGNRGFAGKSLNVFNCEGVVRFNTFAYDSAEVDGGGAGLFFSSDPAEGTDMTIEHNVFYGCSAPAGAFGAAVLLRARGPMHFRNNIIAACTGAGPAMLSNGIYHPQDGCNVFWGNENFDPKYWPPAPLDLYVDPQFCDPLALDFTLQSSSPCANHPNCGQIGRLGVGCGPTGVAAESWARIKSVYRKEVGR